MTEKNKPEKILTTQIDPIFYESTTGKPFSTCISCGRNLLEKNIGYMIEKAVKQFKDFSATDTIFEYALCMNCYEEIAQGMSEISKKRISEYYETHVNFEERRQQLASQPEHAPHDWLQSCLIKGTKKERLSEYQIICQCVGDQIVYFNLPILIGDAAMDEMMQLLSDRTLGEMGKFKDTFLGVPPEFKDLFDDRRILIL